MTHLPPPQPVGPPPQAWQQPQPGPPPAPPAPQQPAGAWAPSPAAPGEPAPAGPRPEPSLGIRLLGVALLLPALVALVVTFVAPTLSTIALSLGGGDGEGSAEVIAGDLLPRLGGQVAQGLVMSLPVVVLGALLGLPLAHGLAMGGALARVATATLLVVGLPAIVVSWLMTLGGLFSGIAMGAVTLGMLPTAIALAALGLAPVVRAGMPARGVVLVVSTIAAVVFAAAVQLVEIPSLVTVDGTLLQWGLRVGLQMGDETAGSTAGLIAIVAVGIAGILLMACVALLAPAVAVDGAAPRWSQPGDASHGRRGLGIAGIVVAIVVAVGALLTPMLVMLGADRVPGSEWVGRVGEALLGTWPPALATGLAQALVAVLAAAGIAWCRPLGRHSLWLLLPFAPWLLATEGPVRLAQLHARVAGDGLFEAAPIPWISAAAIAVLTLVAAGVRAQRSRIARLAWGGALVVVVVAAMHVRSVADSLFAYETQSVGSLVIQAVVRYDLDGVGVVGVLLQLSMLALLPVAILALRGLRGATLRVDGAWR